MKFNIAAAAITGGVGFAIALGIAGVIAMFVDGYGSVFLEMMQEKILEACLSMNSVLVDGSLITT